MQNNTTNDVSANNRNDNRITSNHDSDAKHGKN